MSSRFALVARASSIVIALIWQYPFMLNYNEPYKLGRLMRLKMHLATERGFMKIHSLVCSLVHDC